MLRIYNLKDKQEYIREVAILTQKEWGKKNLSKAEFKNKVNGKTEKITKMIDKTNYCKLLLLDDNQLLGFVSIFPSDGDERKDLSPWYATMYVKKKYRGKGYSKLLNEAILNEARKRKIKRIYLKTSLNNYYEKFGAKFIEYLSNGEKLYYIDLL